MEKQAAKKAIKGINVIGYFKGSFGLGESARLLVDSLEQNNIPYTLVSADSMAEHHHQESFGVALSETLVYPINLFCIDPRHIFSFFSKFSWNAFKNSYNIALCFWETNIIPKTHRKPWSYLDEIWAPTRYVQEHLSITNNVPVYLIQQPVRLSYVPNRSCDANKESFGLEKKFTFLFCFCFYSVLGRKNPTAIIEAFRKAFPDRQDVQLVIKSQNGSQYQATFKELMASIKDDPRIIWIDQSISSLRRYDLMHASDCYISLHRSEGFGLTMAEAMLLEKPVIATGYSGNLDFMTEENSYLCPYRLIRIGKGHPPYSPKGIWADVDIDRAAFWMRHVFTNQEEAKKRAERGRQDVLNRLSCKVVGDQIARRIEKIVLPEHPKPTPLPYSYARYRKKIGDALPFLRPAVRALKTQAKTIVRKFR